MREDHSTSRLLASYLHKYVPVLQSEGMERLQDAAEHLMTGHAGATRLAARDESGELAGVGQYTVLPFDSRLYERKMGRVDYVVVGDRHTDAAQVLLRQLLERAQAEGIEHLHYRIPSAAHVLVRAAQVVGLYLVSSNIHFVCAGPWNWVTADRQDVIVRPGTMDDLGQLKALAREAFSQGTRFHLDHNLPLERATDLHGVWMENCLRGQAADIVLVAQVKGEVAGFVTVQNHHALAEALKIRASDIGLFAVSSAFRRRGIGQRLLVAASEWCAEQSSDMMTVDTENTNVAAINHYTRNGFSASHSTYSFCWASVEQRLKPNIAQGQYEVEEPV